MLTIRTIIGNIVGGAIIAIGVISLVMFSGLQNLEIDDTIGPGERTSYGFSAPVHSEQSVTIAGDSFDVELSTPANGSDTSAAYKGEASLEWAHAADGKSRLHIQNTGGSELSITGDVQVSTDPIFATYHVLVIISGVVISGFSAGLSLRTPRGF